MWGCDLYNNTHLIGNVLPHNLFSYFLGAIVLILVCSLLIKFNKKKDMQNYHRGDDRRDSLEILKLRYAKGEINNDEFMKMKQVL